MPTDESMRLLAELDYERTKLMAQRNARIVNVDVTVSDLLMEEKMNLSGQWTPEERLYVIGWIAAGIRYRNMNRITQGAFPNAETIMGIATSDAASLALHMGPIESIITSLKAMGVRPKTIDECIQEFEELQTTHFKKYTS